MINSIIRLTGSGHTVLTDSEPHAAAGTSIGAVQTLYIEIADTARSHMHVHMLLLPEQKNSFIKHPSKVLTQGNVYGTFFPGFQDNQLKK